MAEGLKPEKMNSVKIELLKKVVYYSRYLDQSSSYLKDEFDENEADSGGAIYAIDTSHEVPFII